jgi:dipeptidase E
MPGLSGKEILPLLLLVQGAGERWAAGLIQQFGLLAVREEYQPLTRLMSSTVVFEVNRRIYLLGGVDILGGEVSPLDHRWLEEAKGKPICMVDLSSKDAARRTLARSIMVEHFSKLTDSRLVFVSEQPSRDDVLKAFENAGAIYLPGGDTEALLENLAGLDLSGVLRSSAVPVVGNSAGALAVCEEVVLTTDDDIKTPQVLPGLGLVPFSIDPHYDSTHDMELFELSVGREIYGLPEQSGIIAEDRSLEFVGPVWRFSDGRKERVN